VASMVLAPSPISSRPEWRWNAASPKVTLSLSDMQARYWKNRILVKGHGFYSRAKRSIVLRAGRGQYESLQICAKPLNAPLPRNSFGKFAREGCLGSPLVPLNMTPDTTPGESVKGGHNGQED